MIIDPNALGAAVGSVEGQAIADMSEAAAPEKAAASDAKTALLLFRAGSPTLKAVKPWR